MTFYEPACEKLLKKNYKYLNFSDNLNNIKDIDIFFICVGTPLKNNKKLEIRNIIDICKNIKKTRNRIKKLSYVVDLPFYQKLVNR